MKYRIDEIRRDARVDDSRRSHARLLVYVSFLSDAGKLLWREGFAMDVPSQITRIVTDEQGRWKRKSDGQFIDRASLTLGDKTEWQRETVSADVPAIIMGNIERVMQRRAASKQPNKRGAHFDPAWQPTTRDAKDILARQDVLALKGVVRTAKEVRDGRA